MLEIRNGKQVFVTDSLALAPYLELEGIKYLGTEAGEDSRTGQNKVYFLFSDPKGVCMELQTAFFRSRDKSYKDLLNFYRGEVSRTLGLSYKRR